LTSWEVTLGNIDGSLRHEGVGLDFNISLGTYSSLAYTGEHIRLDDNLSSSDSVVGYAFTTTSLSGVPIGFYGSGDPDIYGGGFSYRTLSPAAALDINAGVGKEAARFVGNTSIVGGNLVLPSGYKLYFTAPGASKPCYIWYNPATDLLEISVSGNRVMGW